MKVLKHFSKICHNITSEYASKPVKCFSVRWCHTTFFSGVDTNWERGPSSLLSGTGMCVWVKCSWHGEDGLLEKGGGKSWVSEAIAILFPQCSAERQLEHGPNIQGWQEETGLETFKGRRKGAWCPWERKLMWDRWPPPKSPNMKAFTKKCLKGELALQAYWKAS